MKTSLTREMFSRCAVYILCTFLKMALGYPNGQIQYSCSTMLPLHGSAKPSTAASPFSISVSKNSYSSGDEITVTLQANSGSSLKGFLLQARTVSGDAIVGTFKMLDSATTQTLACSGANSTVSHKSSTQKSKVTAVWVAPSSKADVRLRATVLQSYGVFWNRIESQTIQPVHHNLIPFDSVSGSPTDSEPTTSPTENQGMISISSDVCGNQKTCFSNPSGCNPNTSTTCIFTSFAPARGGGFTFEMSGSPGAGYVAVAFSNDKSMGNDDIYGCVLNSANQIEVQHVFSNGKSISDIQPLGNLLEAKTSSYSSGVIKCSFIIRKNISTPARAANYASYYIFLSYGPSQNGNIEMHSKIPAISNQKVNILEFSTVGTANPSQLLHAHGALMLIGWMTTGSLGMICARYLKTAGKKPCFGKDLWFQAHVFLMILTVIATIIAFILAFVSQMSWSGGAHPVLGCIVMALSFFQPILAVFRPAPGTKRRAIFYWGHTLNALAIKVLAVAAIFLGLQLMDTSSNKWMDKVMGGFLGWEALIYIVLQMNTHLKNKSEYQVTSA
ncbi:putative ferric-chelate reductase 1 [Ambystoma mexicanum]|uniref:putative ferric-chelate reductase 1 n=1 Tax=Ambystoma mexicanum TaxID=8296 RepID=UPI0037E95A15